jgi:uncharacterized Zn-finger protein
VSNRAEELLERIAKGVEALAEDPVIHMETAPPVCPYCDTVNPSITVEESGGTGPMAEFVIRALCNSCNRVFYSLPVQWRSARNVGDLEQIVEQQKELTGYGNNGAQQHPREDQTETT